MGRLNSEDLQPDCIPLSECLPIYFQKNISIFGPVKNNSAPSFTSNHSPSHTYVDLYLVAYWKFWNYQEKRHWFVYLFAKIWIVLFYFYFGTFLHSVEGKLSFLAGTVGVYISYTQLKSPPCIDEYIYCFINLQILHW